MLITVSIALDRLGPKRILTLAIDARPFANILGRYISREDRLSVREGIFHEVTGDCTRCFFNRWLRCGASARARRCTGRCSGASRRGVRRTGLSGTWPRIPPSAPSALRMGLVPRRSRLASRLALAPSRRDLAGLSGVSLPRLFRHAACSDARHARFVTGGTFLANRRDGSWHFTKKDSPRDFRSRLP